MKRTQLTQKSVVQPQNLPEQELQQERMQDVQLLLESLIFREQETAKLILASLYDVGSVNLLNQKVHSRTLKWLLRVIARTSKPVFLIFALRWFKRNSPELITRWLRSQVAFHPKHPVLPTRPAPQPTSTSLIEPQHSSQIRHLDQEVVQLRRQVRLLTGVSLGAIAALSGTLLWLLQAPNIRSTPQTSAQSVQWKD